MFQFDYCVDEIFSYVIKKTLIDHERMLSCKVWKMSKISIRDNMPEINTALLWSFIFYLIIQSEGTRYFSV
jgi:hypothetical protein